MNPEKSVEEPEFRGLTPEESLTLKEYVRRISKRYSLVDIEQLESMKKALSAERDTAYLRLGQLERSRELLAAERKKLDLWKSLAGRMAVALVQAEDLLEKKKWSISAREKINQAIAEYNEALERKQ